MTIDIKALAEAFRRELLAEVGAEVLGQIVATNADRTARGDDWSCASQDACDANVVMDDALASLGHATGAELETDADRRAIDAAWRLVTRPTR